ncbi:hypothetical protein [Rhizobium aethiopicum]|uniref:Uncharacterized protein n=1 Tax=Rhizobium aethiopicum TaxID=1138170 RepID=A0A7W6MJD6_9HYPH|nr:hypothetical protein [Rhizobium aethiopicum]MBB4192781.1 hypothetical protein [Rhizobium aethiopicum]
MARHASLAEQLSALRQFVQQPETAEPVQTNWTTVAANDNKPPKDAHGERRWRIKPTLDAMEEEIAGEIVRGPDVYSEFFGRMIPGPIIQIGKLRFSDGAQTERCTMAGIDGKPVAGDYRMPRGAMLGTTDGQEENLGGGSSAKGFNNATMAEIFKVDHRSFVPRGKRKKPDVIFDGDASKELAKAIANTEVMPDVKKCPDGLSLGASRISDNFIGLKRMPSGKGGSEAWQDVYEKMEEKQAFLAAERDLSEKDRAAIASVRSAKTLEDIGVALGQSRKYAKFRGGGKRALLAANENLRAAINKYVSGV